MKLMHGLLTAITICSSPQVLAVTIEGYVRNREGAYQAGTEVTAYAFIEGRLKIVKSDVTKDNPKTPEADPGYYRIDVADPGAAVIASVRFDNREWQPRLIRDLTGNVSGQSSNHVIHKVLLDKRGPRTFLQILEQIHEYEQLFFLQMMLDKGTRPVEQTRRELRARFMERICSMPDPRRVHLQHREQQDVIAELKREDPAKLPILGRKLQELFELYGIGNPASPGMGAHYPSTAESPCWRPDTRCSRRGWVTWAQ